MKKVYILVIIKDATGNLLQDIEIMKISTCKTKIYETKEKLLSEKLMITEGDERIIIPKYDPEDILIIESKMD